MDVALPADRPSKRFQVVLATTVLLSFISFWRAAAIVLADLPTMAKLSVSALLFDYAPAPG